MELKFQVYAKIKKPVEEVFDAVYNPKKLSTYFTTGGASGPLDEGTSVMWDFADFPGAFPVHIKQMIKNEKIVFEWQAAGRDYNTRVEMSFRLSMPDRPRCRSANPAGKKTRRISITRT